MKAIHIHPNSKQLVWGEAPHPLSQILGLECAGLIIDVGSEVSQWQPGDRVCALLSGGGYANTVICSSHHLLPIPTGFTFEQAAALPEAFATAWLNIFMEGNSHKNPALDKRGGRRCYFDPVGGDYLIPNLKSLRTDGRLRISRLQSNNGQSSFNNTLGN